MFNLTTIIANIPALLVGFAFHEYAHAWVADRLGDPTPRSQGRLTLNPFVHLDIFGTLMAVLYSFGWAKPVMTQPHYFKGNKERGRVLVSVAGPLANLLVAFIAMMLWILTLAFLKDSSWIGTISTIFMSLVIMNLGLGVFNILPIPPLDGFSILRGVVPGRYSKVLDTLETYGMFILVIILFTNFLGVILQPAVSGLYAFYRDTALFLLSPFIG
ncbi:site-2 protease family protein [Desulfitobacterium chlororespirans]|uniref:Zn-dependent protease (Includes SpoIVFB) n=1 Tax=Desulfitobacterium chlororespirans DSM 11544 TaxID=1121395 RepID=A0A1M7U4Y7_9FIRM|nr:site-2 protease family protein [Desulfitobacterium chlororespirans]SHN78162.1 Zn-dependent protease (includes SpoIVFB) [Desulfitobacterium chlororespirans DSM 11544]